MNTLIKPPCCNGETHTPLSAQQQNVINTLSVITKQQKVYIIGTLCDEHTAYLLKQTNRKDAIIEFCDTLFSAPYVGCNGTDGTYHMSYLIEANATYADSIISLFEKMPSDFNEDTIEDVLWDKFEADIVEYSDCVAVEGAPLPAIIIQTQDRLHTLVSYDAVGHNSGFYDCKFSYGLHADSIIEHINSLLKAQDCTLLNTLRALISTPGTYYLECCNCEEFYTNTEKWLKTSELDKTILNRKPSVLIQFM